MSKDCEWVYVFVELFKVPVNKHVVVLGKVPRDGRLRNWKMKWKTHHIKRTFQNLLNYMYVKCCF